MATGQRKDPYANFNFLVELDGITRAAFTEVSGLDSTIDVVEYREGGSNTSNRKLPGMTKFSNITLKWGLADDHELYDWHKQCSNGDIQRKNGSVILLDRQGNQKMRWNFLNAWPTKWTGPSFNAQGHEIAIETLELAHEHLERA